MPERRQRPVEAVHVLALRVWDQSVLPQPRNASSDRSASNGLRLSSSA